MKRIHKKRLFPAWFLAVTMLTVFTGCASQPAGEDLRQTEEIAPRENVSIERTKEDGKTQQEPEAETVDSLPGVLLSEEELVHFNEIFFETQADINYCLPVNGFFNSFYEDVTELDFVEFLRYHPDNGILEAENAAEFEALSKLLNFPWSARDFEKETLTVNDLPTPTHRILRSSVDETLQKYAGITTADLKNAEGALYLPEYDAYYNFTSDFGPGLFRCVGGKRDETTIRLWSDIHSYDGSREILTLQETEENFYIKSFQNIK